VIFVLPEHRLTRLSMVAIGVTLILCLGVSAFSAGAHAPLTGPGFVLAFVWLGLLCSPKVVVLAVPAAAIVDFVAMSAAGVPSQDVGSAFILMPIAGLVGVVTSRNATHLRVAQAEIKGEERWRAAIMATLAHDVRAPLTSIIGALEVVSDDPRTLPEHQPLLAAATRQTSRIMRLATGLLEVERIDQGKLRLDTYDIHLRELLGEIVEAQLPMVVELDVEPDLLVWADRERLEQIVVNLLGNAKRHGAEPVVISASSTPSGWQLSVRDHGPGVPAADVPHLFERLGPSGSTTQSVGLGLWIVKLLAEAHGGSVEYQDATPGARFIVRFPPGPDLVELDRTPAVARFASLAAGRPPANSANAYQPAGTQPPSTWIT
jgi:signal transduction histidine kinase